MKLLGFYIGHDTNISLSIDGIVKYRKSERYFGIKHHKAKIDFVFQTLKDWGFSVKDIDYCAYSDGNRNNLGLCGENELFCNGKLTEIKSFCIDHHYAHILSLWPVINIKNLDVGISIDGRGDNYKSVKVIKNLNSNPVILHDEPFPHMGWDFYKLGDAIGLKGLEYDIAGKIMGLQSYSEEQIIEFGITRFKDLDLTDLVFFKNGAICETFRDWHEYWWGCTKELFNKFCNKGDIVGYAGGCAQNTVFNYRLKKIYPNLFIPPHPYDGGISLGCIEFLRILLGEKEFLKEGFPYWQDDEIKDIPSEGTIKKAAKMLAEGKIIGWAQGRGELGPRALGNRSILMSAEKPENKNIINKKVKKREPWRPFAGTVLEEFAKDYVDLNSSKFMLYACKVLNNKIPAITHVDNTCRIQTLSKEDNLYFYNLMSEYHRLTGVPVLLNTSLNVMGKPIASDKNQINKLAKIENLDAVFVGDKIYRNKFF